MYIYIYIYVYIYIYMYTYIYIYIYRERERETYSNQFQVRALRLSQQISSPGAEPIVTKSGSANLGYYNIFVCYY